MDKKKFLILVVLSFVVWPIFSRAGTSDTIAYLKSQSQNAWTVQALAALGEANIASDHLSSVSGTLATDYAKTILAVAAVGQDPKTFGNIDYLAKLKTYYNNNQMGDSSLLNDDMWSVLALSAAGEIDTVEINAAKRYILENQNQDGGWSYAVGGPSDTNDTAAAIVALLEAGADKNSNAIVKALTYLKSTQNEDGGFGWQAGSNSDSGSDAWVLMALNKLGASLEDWTMTGNTPLDHLKSLEDVDGAYWWVLPGTSDYNNKAMTAYAAVAVAGKSYPVAYFEETTAEEGHKIRIEGESSTICNVRGEGQTALELLKNVSETCNFSYVIEETSYGAYLSGINNETAAGMSGWMYFVNNESLAVGAADYVLQENDEVLFYYGDWGWAPSRLSVEKKVFASGEKVQMSATFYQDSKWTSLEGASVLISNTTHTTNGNGQLELDLADGVYSLMVSKTGFVRSERVEITVGKGVSQKIGLVVEIEQTDEPVVDGESLIFEISPAELDFGKISVGQSQSSVVTLKNLGTVDLDLSSFVGGEQLFVDNIKINKQSWSLFGESLLSGENKGAEVELLVPADFLGAGVKTGELIFWAKPL